MIQLDELNNTFVTADHHLDHKNIIQYCNRPFESAEQMDEALISNWNEVVAKDDIVHHLGDFTLGDFSVARQYLSRLNGKIHILGNHWHHDKRWLPKNFFGPLSLISHVTISPPMVVLEVDINAEHPLAITLCHYPLAVWDRKHYGAWMLHGHTHKQNNSGEFILNVGVDCMNYSPISLGNVMTLMYEKGWA